MKEYNICGKLKKFKKLESIHYYPDAEHFCGLRKGHKGKHKCLYTNCGKRW